MWKLVNKIRIRSVYYLLNILKNFDILFPFYLLVVLIIRMLSPFIAIRLRQLDIGRIGGTIDVDWYLCEKEQGKHPEKYFDIFYFVYSTGKTSNGQWKKVLRRRLCVFPVGWFAEAVDELNRKFSGYAAHTIPMFERGTWMPSKETARNIVANYKSFFLLSVKEEIKGQAGLRKLGVNEGKEIVCFHNRDSAYLNQVYPQRDWRYHNYRDSNIQNYLLAAEELTRKGYCIIRLGAIVKDKIQTNNPAIIDYAASRERNDFMDVYLGAKCRFMVCSETGLALVPLAFRRPVVFVNYVIIKYCYTYFNNGTIIPKKFYSTKEKRCLKFSEIVNSKLNMAARSEIYEKDGIELIENTPEEIMDAVVEMDDRLNGRWMETDEDKELQERFWSIIGKDIVKRPETRIGAKYLRENHGLLE